MLAAERSALVSYLPTLSDGDWRCQSPCAGWSVHDLVAHVVAGAKTTPLTFGPSMIAAGFSFDRLAARGIRQIGDASPQELTAALRARIDGLKLSATDHEWTTGTGPEVEGPLVFLVMAICGRGFALDELKGPGTDQLSSRFSS